MICLYFLFIFLKFGSADEFGMTVSGRYGPIACLSDDGTSTNQNLEEKT